MPRIRTIKPEFFRHEELFDLEQETGLPIRLAFAGLLCCCDREGRFRWRPKQLKLDVLPWDDVDFSRVLHALTTRQLVVQYTVKDASGRVYEFGFVPNFKKHQVINNRESDSLLPDPQTSEIIGDFTFENHAWGTRAPRDTDLHKGKGKRKGNKERNIKEKEKKEKTEILIPDWVPKDSWNGFVEMRKSVGAPLTKKGIEIIINQLDKFRKNGFNIKTTLDQSTANNWKGVFEPKPKKQKENINDYNRKALERIRDAAGNPDTSTLGWD